jgi:hypothetical protein
MVDTAEPVVETAPTPAPQCGGGKRKKSKRSKPKEQVQKEQV